jgi:hypothetical protein
MKPTQHADDSAFIILDLMQNRVYKQTDLCLTDVTTTERGHKVPAETST